MTNDLAYYKNTSFASVKSFMALGPGANVIKLFTAVNYGFSYLARVFVIGKLLRSILINTLV